MDPDTKKRLFYIRALMYVAFAVAYVSGVVLFIMLYENYWAAGGFSLVIALILVRLWQFLMPPEKLYMMFPVASWQRGLWQASFFCLCLGGIGVGLWLFARALQKRQNWTGDSYFCSMTGVFMAAKWGFFLTLPIKDLRPDTMDEETLEKLHILMNGSPFGNSEISNEPYAAVESKADERNMSDSANVAV